MIGFLKRLRRNERGNTLILTAAAMPLLIGSAGLATDTIQWALWKRQLQKAADSAAIAGVYAKMAGQDAAVAVNYDVGYPSQPTGGPNNNRTGYTLLNAPAVTYPSNTADYINAVRVRLQMQQTLPFSSMFLSSTPVIEATATAAGIETGEYCAQAQINTNATGISAGGNVSVNLRCGMITNSTSMDAAVAFGSSVVAASPVAAVGGLDTTDNWARGTTLIPFTLAQPDPFSDINPPTIPSPCSDQLDDSPNRVTDFTQGGTQMGPVTKCLNKVDIKGTMTLQPGTYIVTSNFKVNSSATVNCTGCTFIMTNSNPASTGTVDINGGATLNISAPDSGTYKGILFYSDRGADPAAVNKINGNSTSFFKGAFYFPHQKVEYTGNAGIVYECVKLVSWQLTFLGNSGITNNCPSNWYDDRFKGRQVRLVA